MTDDNGAADSVRTEDSQERRMTISLLVVVFGALVMVAGLALWWQAGTDRDLELAKTRDQVVKAATERVETLNTLDYRDIDEGLKSWLAASTGSLHQQLFEVGVEDRKLLEDQKKVTTAKVVDLALTEIDLDRGFATALTSLEISVKGLSGDPVVKRNRYAAELSEVDGEWLLGGLQQVSVNLG